MNKSARCTFAALALLASCETAPHLDRDLYPEFQRGRDIVAQGWFGLSELESDAFQGADLPVIGGAFQQPLIGHDANLGVEGGISFDWDGDVKSVSSAGGGITIVTDNNVLLADLFGGPYGEIVLGERLRFYGAGGWALQYARCDADIHDPTTGDAVIHDDDFGGGIYARGGIEYVLPSGQSFGFGVRYIDTEVSFGGPLGTYDFERVQWFVTFTSTM